MHIGILSFRAPKRHFMWEEKRLEEEAKKRGHEVSLFRASSCLMEFDGNGGIGIRSGRNPLPKFDLLIPRASALTNVQIKIAVIKHFELMGIPALNSYHGILRAKSKLQTLQILSHYGIPVVKTAVINNPNSLKYAVDYIGQFPIIMKTSYGSYGDGVTIVESHRAVKSTYGILAESLDSTNAILIQEYVAEAANKDIRIFIVGEKMVASMERVAALEDFRSNIGQGGEGKLYTPSWAEVHLAIKATKAIGLEVAGVDIIQTKHGPAIMEVNANPGFQELEEASKVNVAEAMIKYGIKFGKEYVPEEVV